MVKAVIFDLDGVIVDSETARLKTYKWLFDEIYGFQVTIDRKKFIGRSESMNIKYLLSKYDLKGDIDYLIMRRSELLVRIVEEIKLIPTVCRLLEHTVNNFPTALATNSKGKYFDAIIKKFCLQKYFDVIVTGENIRKLKPDPEIYKTVESKLNIEAPNCLVFEDSPLGIAATLGAGMKCFGVLSTFKNTEMEGVIGYLEKDGNIPFYLRKLLGLEECVSEK